MQNDTKQFPSARNNNISLNSGIAEDINKKSLNRGVR